MAVKKADLESIKDIDRVAADDGVRFFSATHEEIRKSHVTDIYFLKTLHILRAEGSDRAAAGADAVGVGSYISDASPSDMTMDLKMIGGKPIAKHGRIPGPAKNPRLR